MKRIRIAHYLNQFFGGIGAEDKAGVPLEVRSGPVGPGAAIKKALGDRGDIALTFICGDNYANEHLPEIAAQISRALTQTPVDLFLAGPAFHAGRYGLTCGYLCEHIQRTCRVPALTAMFAENPAVAQHRRAVYIVPTGDHAGTMGQAVPRLAELAYKLGCRLALGPANEEGYLARGIRLNMFRDSRGATRAAQMLVARLNGRPFQTELALETYDPVSPAPAVKDLFHATVAIVSEAGIVPKGNPDRLQWARAAQWLEYPLGSLNDLTSDSHESVHGGFDNTWVNQDPDRVLGVDVLRQMEKEHVIGRVLDSYLVTVGNGGFLDVMARIGRQMATELKRQGVDAVIAPST